jgi:hypothetical protein
MLSITHEHEFLADTGRLCSLLPHLTMWFTTLMSSPFAEARVPERLDLNITSYSYTYVRLISHF